MKQALAILRFLRDSAERGEPAAPVTLTDVTGSAARAPGEHIAVAESGRWIESFSGGCVEAAAIAEAQEVLAVPHLEAHFINEVDATMSPLKAKGVGELGLTGVAPAIANAVYNATGVRVRQYPVTLEKHLAGLPEVA